MENQTSPYTTPETMAMDVSSVARSQRFFGMATLLCSLGVVIPLMLGLTVTAIRIIRAFQMLSHTGSADPMQLADEISMALLTTFWGLVIALLFLIPFVVFWILFQRKKKALRELLSKGPDSEQVQG